MSGRYREGVLGLPDAQGLWKGVHIQRLMWTKPTQAFWKVVGYDWKIKYIFWRGWI